MFYVAIELTGFQRVVILLSFQDLKKAKNGKKPQSTVNWLQCREEDNNGDICGKWRR